MNIKKVAFLPALIMVFLLNAVPAFAHVVVKPSEIGVGARANFVVSVPTEEDVPTIQVRLLIPEGLQSVRPNVKPGWTIEIVKTGEGEEAHVSEIIWSGGSIPAEQRDEFVFSAQAPAEETSLNWKAYQTYAGGMIVAWDKDPKEVEEYTKNNPSMEGDDDHHDAPKPFSVTKVINDLAVSPTPEPNSNTAVRGIEQSNLPMILSVLALAGVGYSLWMQMMKKK
jgi:uncharacterized protein YcnI